MSSRFSSRYRRRQRAEASIPREDPLSEQLDEIAELASSLHSPVAEPLPGSATSLEETELEREETKNASVQGLIASTEEINQELGEEVSVGIPYTDEFPRVETPQDAVIPLSPTVKLFPSDDSNGWFGTIGSVDAAAAAAAAPALLW
ncbi:hypothetical protein QCA50_018812 [Cerrena zonata]|uniref:Uncharacterized protein n=1 Tax=Cerrena zonata TaxID=2478898 RepID=A0AAW0FAF6_9APHY